MAKLRRPLLSQVLAFCAESPVERVFLEDIARRGLGRFLAIPGESGLEALCHIGMNVTPSGNGCGIFARPALASQARMIVGSQSTSSGTRCPRTSRRLIATARSSLCTS